MENANLGPAERIIETVIRYSNHLVHNRTGVSSPDPSSPTGRKWEMAIHKTEPEGRVCYYMRKVGKRSQQVRCGLLQEDGRVVTLRGGAPIANFQPAGIDPYVATWLYSQIAEVWQLDNEFAAKWASFAFKGEHKDLKVALAAFMLVQTRKGEPVKEAGEVLFNDADHRAVGEAMMLLDGEHSLDAKRLLRIYDLLCTKGVADINRRLGFGRSAKNPFLGRWPLAVHRWLAYREDNPKMLAGLVKSGNRRNVMRLVRLSQYKPKTQAFFDALRWKQVQSKAGHRTISIGRAVAKAETWEGMNEEQVCQQIVAKRYNFKKVMSMLPRAVGVTRAVVAASIESGGFSDKELIIFTPTLEELGLLEVPEIKARWASALKAAEDMRAASLAKNVRSKEVKEELQAGAEAAAQKAVEAEMRGIHLYVMVDISSSMQGAIEAAKACLKKLLPAFPEDKLSIVTFNTEGKVRKLPHRSAAGVENAFHGVAAGGGTDYGAGVFASMAQQPAHGDDVLFFFIGDEGHNGMHFADAVTASGLNPMAFALLPLESPRYGRGDKVRVTAQRLGIPCFEVDASTFEDPYAVPRTLRALVASTPVQFKATAARKRHTLVEQILGTKLLERPLWATVENGVARSA